MLLFCLYIYIYIHIFQIGMWPYNFAGGDARKGMTLSMGNPGDGREKAADGRRRQWAMGDGSGESRNRAGKKRRNANHISKGFLSFFSPFCGNLFFLSVFGNFTGDNGK